MATKPLHFSDLKHFSRSPAHYKHALTAPRETTRAMRIGTVVDRIVFDQPRPAVWDGQRRGKEWEAFATAHGEDNVVTMTEWEDGQAIASAVRSDALAMNFLTGHFQVPMEWKYMKLECATRGIDCLGKGWISDMKITHTAEPMMLQRHARRMLWHAQLAWYREGLRWNGRDDIEAFYLVCVEASAPHPVTVLRMTERTLEEGARCCHAWVEQLRACTAAEEWPGYSQGVVDMDLEGGYEGLIGLEEVASE